MDQERIMYECTEEFNLYAGDGHGEDWKKVNGVSGIRLPYFTVDAAGQLRGKPAVLITFNGPGEALELMKSGASCLRVRVAERAYNAEVNMVFVGREHLLWVDLENGSYHPGTLTRGQPAYAEVMAPVREYAMICEGTEVLHAREYSGD